MNAPTEAQLKDPEWWTLNAPEWDGGGLPPVGCECEALFMHGASTRWRKCKVLMYGERECAVFVPEINRLGWCNTFRPLRTPEQRERDEAIKNAARHFLQYRPDTCPDLSGEQARKIAAFFYDAGMLRKGEI